MTGLLAHDDAQRLRSAIADVLGSSSDTGAAAADPTRTALFRVLDVLESSSGAVVLPADAFVTTQQAAELLGVSRMTVVRLIDRGELAAEGGGVHRKIAAAEIERYRSGAQARRRAAIREFAQDITDDLPADRVISTR
ncbi:helix-turn-helix domain-containing protein [Salana multivorans]